MNVWSIDADGKQAVAFFIGEPQGNTLGGAAIVAVDRASRVISLATLPVELLPRPRRNPPPRQQRRPKSSARQKPKG
jgi:hypothetical protein